MAFLNLASELRPLRNSERIEDFFQTVGGDYAFVFESGGLDHYSYLGYDPFLVVWFKDGLIQSLRRKDFFDLKKSSLVQIIDGDPFDVLRSIFKKFTIKGSFPVNFFGGAAGYFSYDFACKLMNIHQKSFHDTSIPDFSFAFFDKVIAVSEQKKKVYFLALAETDMSAHQKLKEIKNDLRNNSRFLKKSSISEPYSNISKIQYHKKISQIKDFLKHGDTYQVNFSQRFQAEGTLDSWAFYKTLKFSNPSPFSCYFEYPNFEIVSSSPELLLRKRNSMISTWPIKGTIGRDIDSHSDQVQENLLLASEKDESELAMIIDLERNDLGKVCKFGTVHVEKYREIQQYSHVIHTVSKIHGILQNNKDIFDAFLSLFPGGSITGCPKKRTMEIIDKLEDYTRDIYTGSAGYISFAGDSDFNILIRTLMVTHDALYFHSGGGITLDSDPEDEYAESLLKSQIFFDLLKSSIRL